MAHGGSSGAMVGMQDKHPAAPPLGLFPGVLMGVVAFGGILMGVWMLLRHPHKFMLMLLVSVPLALWLGSGTITSTPLPGWCAIGFGAWLGKGMLKSKGK